MELASSSEEIHGLLPIFPDPESEVVAHAEAEARVGMGDGVDGLRGDAMSCTSSPAEGRHCWAARSPLWAP